MATPAPSAISPSFMSFLPVCGLSELRRHALAERLERLPAAFVELAEELDVVETERLDHRAQRGQRQVERVEERPDEEAQQKISAVQQRLMDEYGYDAHSAQEALSYVTTLLSQE